MKSVRLAIALVVFLSITLPAQADGPGPYRVHLPIIAGCDMTTFATLEISDGSVTIDLLRGNVHLSDWKPAIPQLKSGGIWQDSALATGRRMVDRRFGNVSDSLSLVISSPDQDDTIREIGDLLHLLEKARDFTASSWQSDPVWIKRQSGCETNPTYALIFDYKIPQLSNPYAAPFAAATQLATMNNFTLSLEHSIWLSCQPGTGECTQTSSEQSWRYDTGFIRNHDTGGDSVYNLLQTANGDIYAAWGNNLYRSQDDTASWALNNAFGHSVGSLLQAANGYIYAGLTGGGGSEIDWSQDDGASWALCTALPAADVESLYQLRNGDILAGESGQVWISHDNGTSWAVWTTVPAGYVYSILEAANGDIYLGEWAQVWRSQDGGVTWTIVLPMAGGDYGYCMVQSSSGAIFVGTLWTIWISRDNGNTWGQALYNGTSTFYSLLQLSNGNIYAGDRNYIWRSIDDGTTWTVYSTLPAGLIQALLQTASGKVVAGDEGWILVEVPTIATMGAAATCGDSVFVANKQNMANITNIYVNDGGAWSANLFPFIPPGHTHLLPDTPAVNDAVYFGISTAIADSGPFESLVFDLYDIITYDNSYTITWEYVSAVGPGPGFALTWSTLTVQDGTNPGTGAFRTLGVSSVHWEPPASWVDTGSGSVNGVTGWWVRARVSALAGNMTAPSQQNRSIYTIVLPYADIAAAQVGGDIPALAQVKLNNRSDKDGRGGSGPDLWDNRVIIGLRSYDRGPTFTAYLNAADEQNSVGITVTLGAGTAYSDFIGSITGRQTIWSAVLGDTTFTDRVTFTLGSTIARDFYGSFHAFLRALLVSGSSSDIHARLQVRTGSGGVTLTSQDDYLKSTGTYEVLDLGRVSIPASGVLSFDDLGDSTVLAVQFRNDSGADRSVYIYDLILIPVDEMAIDAVDYANITASIVGRQSSIPHLADFDSLTYHKVDMRTLVRTADGNSFVTSVYVPGGGPAILQANARQRLWVFAMQTNATGTAYVWVSPPWIAHSVQVLANPRWLGLRGDR